MIRTALQVAFWLGLAVWTYLLVRPGFPQTSSQLNEWHRLLPYLVQKGLHFGGYAGLAAGALTLFRRWRWWVFGGVVGHAVLSELGQYYGNRWFATGRSGEVTDVLIDWAGVAVGTAAWWGYHRLRRVRPTPA